MIYPYNNLGAPYVYLSCIVMYALSNMLCLLFASDVTVWSEDTCNIVFRLHADSFPLWGCVENFINCFSWAGGSPCFKRNAVELSTESSSVSLFSKFS